MIIILTSFKFLSKFISINTQIFIKFINRFFSIRRVKINRNFSHLLNHLLKIRKIRLRTANSRTKFKNFANLLLLYIQRVQLKILRKLQKFLQTQQFQILLYPIKSTSLLLMIHKLTKIFENFPQILFNFTPLLLLTLIFF